MAATRDFRSHLHPFVTDMTIFVRHSTTSLKYSRLSAASIWRKRKTNIFVPNAVSPSAECRDSELEVSPDQRALTENQKTQFDHET